MNRIIRLLLSLSLPLVMMFTFTACDWSSGSQNDYNTSSSDGSNVSGFYEGLLSGGYALNDSSLGVTSLSIQQSGNAVTVRDNQGSTYQGNIGNALSSSNNTLTDADDTTSGTIYFTYQLGFTGINLKTGREISFTGVIEVKLESVIVGGTYDPTTGEILSTITEDLVTNTLKGTWIEGGVATSAFAQTPGAEDI